MTIQPATQTIRVSLFIEAAGRQDTLTGCGPERAPCVVPCVIICAYHKSVGKLIIIKFKGLAAFIVSRITIPSHRSVIDSSVLKLIL